MKFTHDFPTVPESKSNYNTCIQQGDTARLATVRNRITLLPMNAPTKESPNFRALHRAIHVTYVACLALAALPLCGCGRDARFVGKNLPTDLTVRPVTHYGLTLDDKATPEQVGFVLLRAMKEDFAAKDPEARKAAMNILYDITAMEDILALHPASLNPADSIYTVVKNWTPTVAHYAAQLPTEWESAKDRLTTTKPHPSKTGRVGVMECQVLFQFDDPQGDTNGRVVFFGALVQDKGLWRVRSVGFFPNRRVLASKNKDGANQPTAAPDNHDG